MVRPILQEYEMKLKYLLIGPVRVFLTVDATDMGKGIVVVKKNI